MKNCGTAKAYHKAMEPPKIPACKLRPGDKFALNSRGSTWQVRGISHTIKHFRVEAVSLDSGRILMHEFTPSKLLDVR